MMDPVSSPASNPSHDNVAAPAAAGAPNWQNAAQGMEEDDLASTQIISSLTANELAAEQLVDPEAGKRSGGDKELLAELKAVINKKFDEIVD